MNFLETLVIKGIINRYQIDEIIEKATKEEKSIEKILQEMEISDDDILDAKSSFLGINKKKINYDQVEPDIVRSIPEDSAKIYKMVAFAKNDDGSLDVGMLDPRNIEAQNVLQFITAETGTPYNIFILTEEGYERILEKYKGISNEMSSVIGEFGDVNSFDVEEDDVNGNARAKRRGK